MQLHILVVIVAVVLCAIAPRASATLGTDVSQLTSIEAYQCLAQNNYIFTVARAYRESGSIDPNAVSTIANAWAGGMQYVDAYIYPAVNSGKSPETQIQETHDNLSNSKYGMLWLDIEGTWSSDYTANVNFIQGMVNEAAALNITLGMYTSKNSWTAITGNSDKFSSIPLWYPHYENTPNPSFSDFVPFGGWSKPNVKQYKGTTSLCGASVDENWY